MCGKRESERRRVKSGELDRKRLIERRVSMHGDEARTQIDVCADVLKIE